MNEPAPPASVPAQPEDQLALDKFARELPKRLPAEMHSALRCAEAGLFVSEHAFDTVVDNYKVWYQQVLGQERELSQEKCVRKLFGVERPELFYLLDGKACLVGYLAPGSGLSSLRIAIPSCIGAVLSARETLHPRDPIFTELAGVKATLGADGFTLEIEIGQKKVSAGKEVIERFGEIVQRNRSMSRLFPRRTFTKRAALPIFVRCVRRARKARLNRALIIPSRFRQGNFTFFTVAGMVFVEDGQKIIYCYGLFSGPLIYFLDGELDDMGRTLHKKRQGPLEIGQGRNRRAEIRMYSEGERIIFDSRSIIPLLIDCHRDRETDPKHFTYFDFLRCVSRLFEHSSWVAPNHIPKNLLRPGENFQLVRSSHNWYFFMDRGHIVRKIARTRADKPYHIMARNPK